MSFQKQDELLPQPLITYFLSVPIKQLQSFIMAQTIKVLQPIRHFLRSP